MRIERLPVENARMQGAERRQWYSRNAPEHLQAVSDLIDQTLDYGPRGGPRRAVVLGAGACTELPLERLVSSLDLVVLVDIDVAGMRRACRELPPSLQERTAVMGVDITGGVSQALESELRRQPWDDLIQLAGPHGTTPLDSAAGCLERCAVPDPPLMSELSGGDGFDIVISSLVLTQLFSLPLLDVVDTLALHAPHLLDLRDAHPRYLAAANRFRRRIALAHLSLLSTLLAPAGVCLFASDMTGYLVWSRSGKPSLYEALPVLTPEVLSIPGDFQERFRLLGSTQRWQWLATGLGDAQPGRLYDVCGFIFANPT